MTAKARGDRKGQSRRSHSNSTSRQGDSAGQACDSAWSARPRSRISRKSSCSTRSRLQGPPIAIAFAPGRALAGRRQAEGHADLCRPSCNRSRRRPRIKSGVTRGAEGPRAPALPGFEADNKAASFSGVDKAPGDDRLTARLPTLLDGRLHAGTVALQHARPVAAELAGDFRILL